MMRSTAMPAILFALLLISCGAQALPGDEQKPIEIEADRAELDDATGTATYSGSVRLDQGSLKVRAARLIIETDAQQVQRITAEGDREQDLLARYEQTPSLGLSRFGPRPRRSFITPMRDALSFLAPPSLSRPKTASKAT